MSVIRIENEQDHKHILSEIEKMIEAGAGTIRDEDLDAYGKIAIAIYEYEQIIYRLEAL